MNDDHDRCKWVNVSSGTGSPGLSWTKCRQRKTVVCVCVCDLCVRVICSIITAIQYNGNNSV